ncbi:unnamed protein product, partial [Timema podura]|nr:unnamed protein product [Timema podura]
MQCFVLEAILHLEADNTSLNRVFQLWPDVKQAFLSCTFQDFNKECRYLLNILNHALGPKQLVFSLPCVRLYVGTEELSKPKGSSNMWVDINCGSRTVSAQHLNPHSQKTLSSVLIVDHHKVANAALEKRSEKGLIGSDEYVVLRVSLNKANNGFSSTQIKILFKKSVLPLDLENILKRLFGDTFQVMNNKRILKPIKTSSKASISKELENLSTDSKKKHKSKYSKIIRKEIIHTAAYDPIVKLSCEQNTMIRTMIQNAETESDRFHNHKEGYPTSEEHNTYNGIPSLSCLQSTQEMLENHIQKRSRYLSEFQAKVMRKLQSCFSDTYERNQKQRFAVVNRYLIEIENEMQVMEAHQTQLKTFEQQLTRLREYITKIISSQSISSKNVSHSLSEMRDLHRKLCDELGKLESSHKNDLDTDMKSAREKSFDVMRQFWAHERKQAFLKMNLAIQSILLC